jgi:kojibiose phosphorylase
MTLPDWTGVRVWVDEQPLSLQQGEILEHRRILDMKRGMFWRDWRHRDPRGRITRIIGFRLASLPDRHLLLQSVALSAENYSGVLRLESSIELSPGGLPSAPADWKTRRSSERANVLPLTLRTPGRDLLVSFGVASQMQCSPSTSGERDIEVSDRGIAERFRINVSIGSQSCLHRLITVYTSRDVERRICCFRPTTPAGMGIALGLIRHTD